MGTVADYRQTDKRWSGIPYAGDYVYGSGCGAVAVANVIHAKNDSITPTQTATWLEKNGYTCNGAGTYWGGIVAACKHWGMKAEMLGAGSYGKKDTAAEKTWKEKMKTGAYYGILLMGKSMFTTSGHYITIVSWDGNVADVHDPYSAGLCYKHKWADFAGMVKVFYLIEKPKSTSNASKPTANQYRVRKSWADSKSQIGAFGNLNNAVKLADSHKGYNVYDSSGKCVHAGKQNKVTVQYYAATKLKTESIAELLKAIGVDNSYNHRCKIAKANGISNYTGTADQNTKLAKLLKAGKLVKA